MELSKSKLLTMISPILILSALLILSSAQPISPPPPTQSSGCTSILVSFSPCLPYVASVPNNISANVSSLCCDVFWPIFESGDSSCLCYLLRQPHLLGFPLNPVKIRELPSVCPARNATAALNTTIELICLGSPTLPPLRGVTPAIALPNSTDSSRLNKSTGFANPPAVTSSPSTPMADSMPTPPSSISDPVFDYDGSEEFNITMTSPTSTSLRLLSRITPSLVIPLAVTISAAELAHLL